MSKMTTISTTYARICILLLAVNFVFTTYAITKLTSLEDQYPPEKVMKETPDEDPPRTAE